MRIHDRSLLLLLLLLLLPNFPSVPEEFMNNFMDVWSENDPQATKFIPLHRVGRLMCDLDVQPPIFKDAKEANIALVNMDIAMIERPDGNTLINMIKM